jgi:hypothetical protein
LVCFSASAFADFDMLWLKELNGEELSEFPATFSDNVVALLLNRTVRRRRGFEGTLIFRAVEKGFFKYCWHMKKSRDSLGHARRSPGSREAIE